MNVTQIFRNTRWGRNTRYLKHDEVQSMFPKLWKFLQVYGEVFDDDWSFRLTRKYVLMFPVWDKPQSGSFWEDKDNRSKDSQQVTLITLTQQK